MNFSPQQIESITKYREQYNPGHDDTQIEYFIVGNNHTDYWRYKQAIAEVNTHYEALQTAYILQKKNNAEIQIFEAEIEELREKGGKVNEARIKLKEAEIEEKQLGNKSTDKQIQRNTNELLKTMALAEKFEKLIEWKDRKVLEREYHKERLSKLLALNTVWGGGNLSGVMDIITALPDEDQIPLLDLTRELNTIKSLPNS